MAKLTAAQLENKITKKREQLEKLENQEQELREKIATETKELEFLELKHLSVLILEKGLTPDDIRQMPKKKAETEERQNPESQAVAQPHANQQ